MALDLTKNTSNYVSAGVNQLLPLLNGAAYISGLFKFAKDSHGVGGDSDFVLQIPIDDSNPAVRVRLRGSSTNRIELTARSGTGDTAQAVSGGTALSTGVAYSGGFGIDFAADDLFVYLNGALDGSNTSAGFANGTLVAGTPSVDAESIGSAFTTTAPDGTDRQLDGSLAELALYAGSAMLNANDHAAYADGVSPLLIKPKLLAFYAPFLVGGTQRDLIANKTLAVTGTVAKRATHPPMRYPSRPRTGSAVSVPPGPGSTALLAVVNSYGLSGDFG